MNEWSSTSITRRTWNKQVGADSRLIIRHTTSEKFYYWQATDARRFTFAHGAAQTLETAMSQAQAAFDTHAAKLAANNGIRDTKTIAGWLRIDGNGEEDDILFLDNDPLAEALDFIRDQVITVRYFTSDKAVTEDEAQTQFLNELNGVGDANYQMHYSEITGYLYTTEELAIGGHDLLGELKGQAGRYLLFIVDIHGAL